MTVPVESEGGIGDRPGTGPGYGPEQYDDLRGWRVCRLVPTAALLPVEMVSDLSGEPRLLLDMGWRVPVEEGLFLRHWTGGLLWLPRSRGWSWKTVPHDGRVLLRGPDGDLEILKMYRPAGGRWDMSSPGEMLAEARRQRAVTHALEVISYGPGWADEEWNGQGLIPEVSWEER